MEVIRTLAPGKPGTRKLQDRWGNPLVTVRDRPGGRIHTTAQVIVDPRPERPGVNQRAWLNQRNRQPVALRIEYEETELRARAKAAGAAEKWTDLDISFEIWPYLIIVMNEMLYGVNV